MWSMLKNLLAQGDNEGGWRKFLPFIILMVLYGLSSLFKNKPKKPPTRSQPRPGPSQQQAPDQTQPSQPGQTPPVTGRPPTRLPSYARKRTTSGQPPQPARATSPQTARPRPATPTGQHRPVERPEREPLPTPTPRTQPKPTQDRIERSVPAKKTVTQTARHIQTEKKPRTVEQRPKPQRTSTSAKTAVKALHSRHQHVAKPERVAAKPLTATERLAQSTSGQGALVQAILYGEILGTPMALRPRGSHQYIALGSSGRQ